jgi:hypothetical protein
MRFTKALLVCSAFATFCFLNTWVELGEGKASYFARFDPRRTVALPVICCEAILVVPMLTVWGVFRRRRHGALPHILFLGSCAAPVGISSVAMLRLVPFDLVPVVRHRLFWPLALAGLLIPAAWALYRPRSASRAARIILLYSCPVLVVVLVQAARVGLSHPGSEYQDGTFAPKLSTIPPVRVFWVVFDELSEELAFEGRPPNLQLPNFDRLRAESFFATAAEPPGSSTDVCMPSLILGEKVTEANPLGPADQEMRIGQGTIGWRSRSNVFDTARSMGYNTALVGWFHPYGRLLSQSLTEAYWTASWMSSGVEEPSEPGSLLAGMESRVGLQVASLPLVGHLPGFFPGRWARRARITRLGYLLARAEQVAGDISIGLVLVHLPVPHPPPVYNRDRGAMDPDGKNSYLDSLALADRVLGRLREKIDAAPAKTVLLVSADHGWRPLAWRGSPEWTPEDESLPREGTLNVPFILHMPGQQSPAVYERPFQTTATRDIVTQILDGRLTEAGQVAASIEQSSAR